MRFVGRCSMSLTLAAFLVIALATSAGAQAPIDERSVEITYDTGDFDSEQGDWAITVVYVRGDMEDGVPFTLELLDENGIALWSATEEFTAPTTTLAVDRFVAVGEVMEAAVSQALPEVAGDVVDRQEVEVRRQGAGGSGGGTIALSMVLAVVLMAILFRTPLPSQVSQRWTR